MSLNDTIYAEAVRTFYDELLLRLSTLDKKRFDNTSADDEGVDAILAFIKDNPPKGPPPLDAAIEKVHMHLSKTFPTEEYEVETVLVQLSKAAGL